MLNKIRLSTISFLFLLAICILSVTWQGQLTFNTAQAQSETARLTLGISTSQQSYLELEPISANLTLSNQTDQPISWRGALGSLTHTSFVVTNSVGTKTRLDGSKSPTPYIYTALRQAAPGEQISKSILLDKDSVKDLFQSAGQYNLQVEFVYGRNVEGEQLTKIVSNSIPITIVEPQGVDRSAYQFMKGNLNEPRSRSNERLAQLRQEFVNRFKNSVYAKYMIFDLGNTYLAMGDNAKALRELCKISGENFHYAKDVEKIVLEIDGKLNPLVPAPGIPVLPVKHPCTGRILD